MQKGLLLGIILTIFACSKVPENNGPKSNIPESSVNWYAGVGQFNGSLDFGNLNSEQNKILTITIKNVGDTILAGPAAILGSDFFVAYQNCVTLLPGKTCSVKLSFNSQGKSNQNYSANLMIGEQSALVTASVDLPAPVTELKAFVGNSLVSSLEFGTIKFDQSVLKTIKITNSGKDKGPWVVGQSGNGFVISYDTCSGKEILPTKSCTLKVSLSGAGKSGEITDALTLGNLSLPMSAMVKNLPTVALEESDVKVILNNLSVNPGSVDLGTLNLRQTKILNLYLKNEGTDKGIIEEPEIPLDLQIAFNNCEPGKILNPQASCLMKLVASPQSKGVINSPLVLQGQNYNLQSIVREPFDKIYCPMDNALESYITWSGSNYSDCIVESCEVDHHLIDNQCDPDIISCPVDNGTGLQTWTGSEYGGCILNSCDTHYSELEGECIADSQACSIEHGQGLQTWDGNNWGTCLVSECEENYHSFNNQCDANVINCAIDNGTGLATWNQGTSSYSACVVNSCETGYFKNTVTNTCDIQDSCKTILAQEPSKLNQDGIYTLATTSGDTYSAYCDMTTSGGGWTLLFAPIAGENYTYNGNYATSHEIWVGNDTRNVNNVVLGNNINLSNTQKAVKNVKFKQIAFLGYSMQFSSNATTFAQKFSARETVSNLTGISGLTGCSNGGWDRISNGSHTQTRALLGCYMGTAYGDVGYTGLGIYASRISSNTCGTGGQGGSTGGSDTAGATYYCGRWYQLGNAFHRGGTVYIDSNSKTHMVWGR